MKILEIKKQKEIKRLRNLGYSLTRIEKIIGVSRHTIIKYAKSTKLIRTRKVTRKLGRPLVRTPELVRRVKKVVDTSTIHSVKELKKKLRKNFQIQQVIQC